MSAWSMGLETLCVETNTEEGRSIFSRLSDMGSAMRQMMATSTMMLKYGRERQYVKSGVWTRQSQL